MHPQAYAGNSRCLPDFQTGQDGLVAVRESAIDACRIVGGNGQKQVGDFEGSSCPYSFTTPSTAISLARYFLLAAGGIIFIGFDELRGGYFNRHGAVGGRVLGLVGVLTGAKMHPTSNTTPTRKKVRITFFMLHPPRPFAETLRRAGSRYFFFY